MTKISGNLVTVNAVIFKEADESGRHRFDWRILLGVMPFLESIPKFQTSIPKIQTGDDFTKHQ
ncbi:hypothetical protein D3878_14560 [Noviherbaspirillum sedimenti]|uniref:Uncharacterized protein n=1 Tax=Noviherbaspirillum sedimenti TaxID=2320865 RepID=A0A3A3GK17_9BURK|nr:hypothetical protein D3878_14560 [Noviherbaspirillum sedimenti]